MQYCPVGVTVTVKELQVMAIALKEAIDNVKVEINGLTPPGMRTKKDKQDLAWRRREIQAFKGVKSLDSSTQEGQDEQGGGVQ